MEVTTLGIDLGKNVFHVVGLDARGRVAVKRRVSRSQLIGTEAMRIISRSSVRDMLVSRG
jgi:expansin (peptidoglycan-binding protein)